MTTPEPQYSTIHVQVTSPSPQDPPIVFRVGDVLQSPNGKRRYVITSFSEIYQTARAQSWRKSWWHKDWVLIEDHTDTNMAYANCIRPSWLIDSGWTLHSRGPEDKP